MLPAERGVGNRKTLGAVYGDQSDAWIRKPVEIFVDPNVWMGAERTSGIRVRIPSGPRPSGNRPGTVPPAAPPPVNRRRIAARCSGSPGRSAWTDGCGWSPAPSASRPARRRSAKRSGWPAAMMKMTDCGDPKHSAALYRNASIAIRHAA